MVLPPDRGQPIATVNLAHLKQNQQGSDELDGGQWMLKPRLEYQNELGKEVEDGLEFAVLDACQSSTAPLSLQRTLVPSKPR